MTPLTLMQKFQLWFIEHPEALESFPFCADVDLDPMVYDPREVWLDGWLWVTDIEDDGIYADCGVAPNRRYITEPALESMRCLVTDAAWSVLEAQS